MPEQCTGCTSFPPADILSLGWYKEAADWSINVSPVLSWEKQGHCNGFSDWGVDTWSLPILAQCASIHWLQHSAFLRGERRWKQPKEMNIYVHISVISIHSLNPASMYSFHQWEDPNLYKCKYCWGESFLHQNKKEWKQTLCLMMMNITKMSAFRETNTLKCSVYIMLILFFHGRNDKWRKKLTDGA